MTITEDPALLLVEVMVDDTRWCLEADTDRVWQVDHEGHRRRTSEPEPGLLRCLRAEAVRRYLNAPIDEAALARWVDEQWALHWPGHRVQPLSVVKSCGSAVSAVEFAPDTVAPCPTWCDVESLPARTLALGAEPTVRVFADHVRFAVGAYGPADRVPFETAVVASIWDVAAQRPLVQAALRYDPASHAFAGEAPRAEGDESLDHWRADADLDVDLTSVHQGFRLPRDEDHELAWRRWWALNLRWARAGSLDAVLDEPRRVGSGKLTAEVVQPAECALDVVVLKRGDEVASINPAQPRTTDAPAWRRVALVAFHRYAIEGAWQWEQPGVPSASDIDMALALADAGDTQEAAHLADQAWHWLREEAQELADRPDTYYTGQVAAACTRVATLLGGNPGQELAKAAADLRADWPDIEWELLAASHQAPIQSGHHEDGLRYVMAQWWLEVRARIALAACGVAPDPVAVPMPPAGGSRAIRDDHRRAIAYEPQIDGPDAPMLAEMLLARPV
jgi:hypothetical protein